MSAESTKTQKRTRRRSSGERLRKPGARPFTLPELRARETRRRILDAAHAVFRRTGYGHASVDDILAEAGISRGAFYHHFANKEELFKALLDEHLQGELAEFGQVAPVSSFRELIERLVAYQLQHLESELGSRALSLDFFAEATRDDAIRRPVAEFHRRLRDFIAGMLRAGQGGPVRDDLDVEAAAFLLQALFEGTAVLLSIEPDAVEIARLNRPWTDLVERFVRSQKEEVHE